MFTGLESDLVARVIVGGRSIADHSLLYMFFQMSKEDLKDF